MPGRLPGFGGSLHEALYVPSGPAEPIGGSLRPVVVLGNQQRIPRV